MFVNGDLRHTLGSRTVLRRPAVGMEMASAEPFMRCPVPELGGQPIAERR